MKRAVAPLTSGYSLEVRGEQRCGTLERSVPQVAGRAAARIGDERDARDGTSPAVAVGDSGGRENPGARVAVRA